MIQGKIRQTLLRLRDAISTADSETITLALAELDRLAAEHGRELDPQLLHFLQRRSYDKALAFLAGDDDIRAGICGGKKG